MSIQWQSTTLVSMIHLSFGRTGTFAAFRHAHKHFRTDVGVRSYVKSAEVETEKRMLFGGRSAATVCLADPSNVVRTLDWLPEAKTLSRPETSKSAVVLFSKGFAPHVGHNSPFVREAINKIFTRHRPSRLKAAIAVVDRIPVKIDSQKHASIETSQRLAIEEVGMEGVSFLIADEADLNLQISPQSLSDQGGTPHVAMKLTLGSNVPSCVAKLPVANTLFENGNHNTLIFTEWDLDPHGDLKVTNSTDVQGISANFPAVSHSTKLAPGLSIPHSPLTPIRKIEDGLGNVIRKLSDVESNEFMPASAELQTELTTGFARKGQIFAAVLPPSVYSSIKSESLSGELANQTGSADGTLNQQEAESTALFDRLLSYVQAGASIRRVVGGGGEWGDRASLVTLEPGEPFGNPNSLDLEEDNFLSYVERLNKAAIAPVGHYIQFFSTDPDDGAQDQHTVPLLTFGCTTKRTDLPTTETPAFVVMPDYFGGFSDLALGIENPSAEQGDARRASHVDVHGVKFTIRKLVDE